MTKEIIDTTNSLVKPEDISISDNDVIRQLSENLQDISTEDVNAMCDEMDEAEKRKKEEVENKEEEKQETKWEIPQELKDFRQAWMRKIKGVDRYTRRKIKEIADKIPVKVETEADGTRLIEFEIGGKTWKILDPKLDNYTNQNDNYISHSQYNSITTISRNEVWVTGIVGDNISGRKNELLVQYVKEKQGQGLHIPMVEEINQLLSELGKKAFLDNENEKIAMLMYLTGMDGSYWLSMGNYKKSKSRGKLRSVLSCRADFLGCYCSQVDFSANLCMIACE